jgi:hypothetical protein
LPAEGDAPAPLAPPDPPVTLPELPPDPPCPGGRLSESTVVPLLEHVSEKNSAPTSKRGVMIANKTNKQTKKETITTTWTLTES